MAAIPDGLPCRVGRDARRTQEFLGTLNDAQRTAVVGERRAANLGQWSNLPDKLFTCAGLRMDGLIDTQA